MAAHEVVSAFLDDEPFDPRVLNETLADPEGRALLIDLIALRHLAQPDDVLAARAAPCVPRRTVILRMVAAAGLMLALAAGYQWGTRSGSASTDAPAPTRVISGAVWQDVTEGGIR